MTPYTIENLYVEFRSTIVKKPDLIIGFFEKNAIIINNIKEFKDKEELRKYIQIIEKYLWALKTKGRYNNAIDQVEKYQVFINAEINRLNADELKDEWYYSLYLIKGVASFYLKDYKTATRVFKTLILIDSPNQEYRNWLDCSKYGQWQRLSYFILILAFLLITNQVFFKKYIPSYKIRMLMDVLGMLLAVFMLSYDYYLKRTLRKKKNFSS